MLKQLGKAAITLFFKLYVIIVLLFLWTFWSCFSAITNIEKSYEPKAQLFIVRGQFWRDEYDSFTRLLFYNCLGGGGKRCLTLYTLYSFLNPLAESKINLGLRSDWSPVFLHTNNTHSNCTFTRVRKFRFEI